MWISTWPVQLGKTHDWQISESRLETLREKISKCIVWASIYLDHYPVSIEAHKQVANLQDLVARKRLIQIRTQVFGLFQIVGWLLDI
jgi:hypothetical protein